jgi:hypothetical protein
MAGGAFRGVISNEPPADKSVMYAEKRSLTMIAGTRELVICGMKLRRLHGES